MNLKDIFVVPALAALIASSAVVNAQKPVSPEKKIPQAFAHAAAPAGLKSLETRLRRTRKKPENRPRRVANFEPKSQNAAASRPRRVGKPRPVENLTGTRERRAEGPQYGSWAP